MVHFSLEPNKSERSCLICSGRIHLAPSGSHRFALGLHHAGPIKTIYLMCVGLDTITSLHAIVHLHFHFIYLFLFYAFHCSNWLQVYSEISKYPEEFWN